MSRLQIFPPVATVFPNDRVKFTAQAAPPPAYWQAVNDSGDIKSDFSLEVDAAGSTTSGNVAHWLFSGIGVVEITIDDQCKPTGGAGQLQMQGRIFDVSGFLYLYTLIILPTSVEVRDETSTQIFTESYTTVSGDKYRVELIGGFRFYRQSAADPAPVLKHSRVALATNVVYPMTFRAGIIETTTTAPTRIPQPRLIGDWRIGPIVEWIAPSHGAISYLGLAGSTEFYGGTIPGTYTLTARIESAADNGTPPVQVATATIIIPPLHALGPTEVTLQPGQKVRFKTNYPDDLIAWTVAVGGGSFTQGEYTASADPGTSLIRATADVNDQVADITVIVPAVITNPSNYTAAKASEEIDFASNIAASTMPLLISGGSVASGTGNVTPGMPQGVQEKDVLLAFVQTANEAVSISGGFAAVADSPQGTGTAGVAGSVRLSVFFGRWVPGLTAPTITDPGDHAVAQILAIRGCIESGNPWDVTAGDTAASSTSVSIPGDTTTVNNCLIVLAVANATDTATPQTSGYTNADLSNLTERTDVNVIDGVGGGFAVATGGKAAFGSYGATTATLATASAQGRMSIALKPGSVVWTASIGSINSSSGLWTAPSLPGQTAKITATNGFFTVTVEVPVLEVFPFDLSSPVKWQRRKVVLVSSAEDGTRSSRIKRDSHEAWENTLVNLEVDEAETLNAFWDRHHPGVPFIFENKLHTPTLRKVVYSDSDISYEAGSDCSVNASFRWLEK